MFENINDWMYNTLLIVVFLTALTIFFVFFDIIDKNFDAVEQKKSEFVMENKGRNIEENFISGASIIQDIYLGCLYTYDIDGVIVIKGSTSDSFDLGQIDVTGKYSMNVLLGSDGNIKIVKYTKIVS